MTQCMRLPKIIFILFSVEAGLACAGDVKPSTPSMDTANTNDDCSADGISSSQCHVGLAQLRATALHSHTDEQQRQDPACATLAKMPCYDAIPRCWWLGQSYTDISAENVCAVNDCFEEGTRVKLHPNSRYQVNYPGLGDGTLMAQVCRAWNDAQRVEWDDGPSAADANNQLWTKENLEALPTPAPTPAPAPAPTPASESGTCTIYGDPHILGFDKNSTKGSSFLSLSKVPPDAITDWDFGDFWIVKSPLIYIQGRFNVSPKAQKEQSWLRVLAVGGPFLQNNTLKFGTHKSRAFWNDQEILPTLPSKYHNEIIDAKYHSDSQLVQDESKKVPGVDVDLPMGVKLLLNRGTKDNLAIRITVPNNIHNIDGECGNYNGLASDDTEELISERMQILVSPDEALIDRPARDSADV